MIYALLFYFLAGAVTGAVFKMRCLLLILVIAYGQAVYLASQGTLFAAVGAFVGLVAIQVGYVTGLLSRATFVEIVHLYVAG